MAQFQILEYEEICGVIVQIPKNGMDKIVSPPEESVLFFLPEHRKYDKMVMQSSVSVFIILSACILN